MDISEDGLLLIERFEGFSSRRYWDPYGKVWTRGYGETEGITAASPPISQREAQLKLRRLIEGRYEPALHAIPALNQNEFDALCSFVWNVGTHAVAPGTTIGNLLRNGQIRQAADSMLQWVHAGGVVLQGLVTRRHAEIDLMLTPVTDALEVLDAHEREEVVRYDRLLKHPHLHEHGLRVVRGRLVAFRKAIWIAAERGVLPDGKPVEKGWNVRHRSERYQFLLSRTR